MNGSVAPEKLWMTAEEMGWPGSFRSFRMSDLEHPEDEYQAYVRADLYEQVKRERDDAKQALQNEIVAHGNTIRGKAERLAGARVVTDAMVRAFIRRSSTAAGDTEACIRAGLEAALAEPAGEVEPVAWLYDWTDDNGTVQTEASTQKIASVNFKEVRNVRPLYTTPPDASAIREAAIQLLSAIDAGCGREEIISQTGPLRAALAGAKP